MQIWCGCLFTVYQRRCAVTNPQPKHRILTFLSAVLCACVPAVCQATPVCCTSCQIQSHSSSCCGGWQYPHAAVVAVTVGRCQHPYKAALLLQQQQQGRNCQRSGQHMYCSGVFSHIRTCEAPCCADLKCPVASGLWKVFRSHPQYQSPSYKTHGMPCMNSLKHKVQRNKSTNKPTIFLSQTIKTCNESKFVFIQVQVGRWCVGHSSSRPVGRDGWHCRLQW